MKKVCFTLLLLVAAGTTLAGAGFYKTSSHTLVSYKIISFTDPYTGKSWAETGLRGSGILSWKTGAPGTNGAFGNIVIYAGLPEEKKYRISLVIPTKIDSGTIEGIWSVTENGKKQILKIGTIFQLNYPVGNMMELRMGECYVKAITTFNWMFRGYCPEIGGLIKKDNVGITDALVFLKQKDCDEEDILPAYKNGNYVFLIPAPDQVERLTIQFSNDGKEAHLSGYVYLFGMPWKHAGVEIRINSIFQAEVSTNQEGFFEYGLPPGNPGSVEDIIEIIITPPVDS